MACSAMAARMPSSLPRWSRCRGPRCCSTIWASSIGGAQRCSPGAGLRIGRPYPQWTAQRPHLHEVTCHVARGQLHISWEYSAAVHRRATIQVLADAFLDCLQELLQHCRSGAHECLTPSDFADAELSQEGLTRLMNRLVRSERS